MKKTNSLKISISGVRGIIGESLTPQLAAALAQAFGSYVGAGPVIVGRDARTSGEMIKQAVIAGLLAVSPDALLKPFRLVGESARLTVSRCRVDAHGTPPAEPAGAGYGFAAP